jgi:hydrogenase-1 operon protein HyaF
MKPLAIPAVGLGPGSQPAEDAPEVLDIPQEISTFVMPQVPETEDRERFADARNVICDLVATMSAGQAGSAAQPRMDLTHLDPATIELLNQMLIEGEVSALIAAPDGQIKIQETNFAGVWRLLHYDGNGVLARDLLEACPVPAVIREIARNSAAESLQIAQPPTGVMNSPTVLFEIQEQAAAYRPGAAPHVVNLTLLPMSPQDIEYLDRTLPAGPVSILSRGYGKCRITSTALRNVWRVQYFNNMNTLILNTIEVVDIPEVTKAAHEDLEDSLGRLRELLEWMEQE